MQYYLPVTCTGRQPDSVFGPTVQLDKFGNAIPPGEQLYLWIPLILDKVNTCLATHKVAATIIIK